jgi:hypothetical protein
VAEQVTASARPVSLSPYDKIAIEVVELDGHRAGVFVVA